MGCYCIICVTCVLIIFLSCLGNGAAGVKSSSYVVVWPGSIVSIDFWNFGVLSLPTSLKAGHTTQCCCKGECDALSITLYSCHSAISFSVRVFYPHTSPIQRERLVNNTSRDFISGFTFDFHLWQRKFFINQIILVASGSCSYTAVFWCCLGIVDICSAQGSL